MEELETDTTTEVTPEAPATEEVAPPVVEAEASADKEAEAVLSAEKTEDESAEGKTEEYKPNVKFRVMEKEMEIPKEFHSLMKDADSEKKVRELFEKAEGLPIVKQKLESVRAEFEPTKREVQSFRSTVQNLQTIYQKATGPGGNIHKLDDWFKTFEIPPEVIINYAIAKVKLAELPPEQRQMLEGQMQAERQAETQAAETETLRQTYATQAAQMKTMALESQLTNPETQAMAAAFDAKLGKAGAFKDEVRRVGQLTWYEKRIDLTPEQAIAKVIENYGLKAAPTPATPSPGVVTESGTPTTIIQKKTTSTIPNISGNSKSPVKSGKPRTMEDLKKLRDQAWAHDA